MKTNQVQFLLVATLFCLCCAVQGLPRKVKESRLKMEMRNAALQDESGLKEGDSEIIQTELLPENGVTKKIDPDIWKYTVDGQSDVLESIEITCDISIQRLQEKIKECPKDKRKECTALINKLDPEFCKRTGKLERDEIYDFLVDWTKQFIDKDTDKLHLLAQDQYMAALSIVGHYSTEGFKNLFNRYKNSDDKVSYNDFILSAARVSVMIDEFKNMAINDTVTFTSVENFLASVTKW